MELLVGLAAIVLVLNLLTIREVFKIGRLHNQLAEVVEGLTATPKGVEHEQEARRSA